ncbi:hypothetical protein [Kitasatospora sp. NPDC094015]|uniref:hypothetical protein n=1 Tax=Kitasatospora sp. NPDC094015 TaxID=3155205 RepID=UPI0033259CCC
MFVQQDGTWLHPMIRPAADQPAGSATPQAATVIHTGGGDLHVIKETLRHSMIKLAVDTYSSLLPEVDCEVAERAARMIPRSRRRPDEDRIIDGARGLGQVGAMSEIR